MSVKEYLNKIRFYLSDMINDVKTEGEWKIELTMKISFMSSQDSKNSNETSTKRLMPTKSSNIEIMIGNETDEIFK